MKELECLPPSGSLSHAPKGTFLESAAAVLLSSLGKFWPVSLLGLLSIVFLPAIICVYYHFIKIDPGMFVTEWVKISIEGILLFFILEIVRHRSVCFTARRALLNFVTFNYLIPIQGMIEFLKNFQVGLEKGAANDTTQNITSARQRWSVIEHALSDEALYRLPSEAEAAFLLSQWRSALGLKRCNDILRSLSTVQHLEKLNQAEFKELLKRLESFSNTVRNHYGYEDFLRERS